MMSGTALAISPGAFTLPANGFFPAEPNGGSGGTQSSPPACTRIPGTQFQLAGPLEGYLAGVTEQWLKQAPFSNPAMLEMLRDRDRLPRRDLLPWSGEFAGKYLTAAVQVYRTRRDPELKEILRRFVARLISCQAEDGYLGPWPKASRLAGKAPNSGPSGGDTWDAWGHYHIMLGLLLWQEETGDAPALACVQKIAGLICEKFANARLVDTGSTEMNLAVIHSLCLLHRKTPAARYLKMAEKICAEFSLKDAKGTPLAGDYLNGPLAGKEFFELPKPRWESLHPILGLVELYRITGENRYRQAFENIWWSIVKLDRHNNGGFSSGEQAQGNPYHPGAIETCCTIAWTAMSVEMLRLTANPIVADELELTLLNSGLGLLSPTGRWVTYNTPMNGDRKASAHDIVFQARAGSPELNCCSVNGARGLGMISDWALMAAEGDLILNWYGPSTIATQTAAGLPVTFRQLADYPKTGRIRLIIEPAEPTRFGLRLRIPHWSHTTQASVNGERCNEVKPGTYLRLEREWRTGDEVQLDLDFSLHYWAGERECAGLAAIYRGPLLLAYDRRFNQLDPQALPELDARAMNHSPAAGGDWLPPIVLLEFKAADGQIIRLCDFASAGADGSPYRSWLKVQKVAPANFSRANPRRSTRFP